MLRPILAVGAILVLAFLCFGVLLSASFPLLGNRAARVAELLRQGDAAAVKRDDKSAWEAYDRAIRLDPKNPAAYYRRGAVRHPTHDSDGRLRDHDGRLRDYDEAIRLDPKFVDAYLARGLLKCERGEFDAALLDVLRAEGLRPADPKLPHTRGAMLQGRRKPQEAVEAFTRALKIDPNFVESYSIRSSAWSELGEPDRALADLDSALRIDPTHVVARILRIRVWEARRDFRKAAADKTSIIDQLGGTVGAHLHRAELYLLMGDFAAAQADSAAAAAFKSDRYSVLLMEGRIRAAMGSLRDALVAFDEALRLNSNDPEAFAARGRVRLRLAELDPAIEDATRAIELEGDQEFAGAAAFRIRGLAKLQQHDYASAVEDFKQAAERGPSGVEGLFDPAREPREDHPERKAALVAFEHAFPEPVTPAGLIERGLVRQFCDAYEAALSDYEAAARAAPEDPAPHFYAARLLTSCPDLSIRDGDAAVRLAKKAVQLSNGENLAIRFALAAAVSETGDFKTAATLQKETLDQLKGTEYNERVEARRRLAAYHNRVPFDR